MNEYLNATVKGRTVTLEVVLPEGARGAELRIASRRNEPVVRLSDRSPLKPPGQPPQFDDTVTPDKEIWYPVVDVDFNRFDIDRPIEAVARFENAADTPGPTHLAINPMTTQQWRPLAERVAIPGARLQHWENALVTRPFDVRLTSFYLRLPLNPSRSEHTVRLDTLVEPWAGRIVLAVDDDEGASGSTKELARVEFNDPTPPPPAELPRYDHTPAPDTLDPADCKAALADGIDYLLRSVDTTPGSPTRDGVYLFYDLDARTFRCPHWVWTWGPIVRLLLGATNVPEIADRFGADRLAHAAEAMGRRLIAFQMTRHPNHPADGLVCVRWDPSADYRFGYEGNYSPADSGFLAGWAWPALYERTGDERFLHAAQTVADALDRLTREHEVIPQEYLPNEGDWRPHILNEAGFGTEVFAELRRTAGDDRCVELARRYMGQLIERFEQPDGLWRRWYWRAEKRGDPCEHHTRGQGWAMEGLLACARMDPDGPWREKAARLAGHLIDAQDASGCWPYVFTHPKEEVAVSEKGTALWSLLLYGLYELTGEETHRHAARRALSWCIRNRYAGDDANAHGGIVGCSPHSGVLYRHWYRLTCSYTTSFMGLALLKELGVGG